MTLLVIALTDAFDASVQPRSGSRADDRIKSHYRGLQLS
jgi:hypothetical protein